MIDTAMLIKSLREELGQLIRMLEDDVLIGNDSTIYLRIGKLTKIQSMIEELENVEEGWSEITD